MTFSRLLPLLLLVPALTMADDDRNFKLTSENFKVGGVMEHAAKKAIELDQAVAISQEPVFPLQPNQLYLRYKKSAKEYLWFSGHAKPDDYKKLHAFSLKDNNLGAREVLGLRLYASRQYKAFQDEADIYFDADYIYSPRVSKLLFMKNGKWQVLNECVHPGMVQFNSDEKNFEIVSLNSKLKVGTRAIYPAQSGVYVFSFNAPDKLPYVDAGVLKPGEVLSFNVKFPAIESIDAASDASVDSSAKSLDSSASVSVKPSVTLDQVLALKTLEETEALYDTFSIDVDKNVNRVDTTFFSNVYPKIKPADSLGLVDSGKVYRKYVTHYNLKRSEAQTLWRTKKLGVVSDIYKAFHAKLDSLQSFPLQIDMLPTSVEKIVTAANMAKVDSSVKIDSLVNADSLKLRFGTDRGRIDVVWKGYVEGFSMDSLAALIEKKDSSLKTTLFLVNNKPVWIFKEGRLVGRYQYRYEKVGFQVGDSVYYGKGKFILPLHIAIEPEVVQWLKPKMPVSSSSSVVASSSSAVVDTVKAKPGKKIIEHATRGTIVVVDSGSFRYRGKVVAMSAYAIHTTEVTQEFFHKIMGLVDSTKRVPDRSLFKGVNKPVQNITWEHAQYACKVLGGDLPTEAQWEFAGRAGSNDGTLWKSDDSMDVDKYAVYAGNSLNKGKKDDAYGPHDVATKDPNDWGIYDMSGNVAEWTRDNYFAITFSIENSNPTGSYWGTNKVLKGGSWKDNVKNLNMTVRDDEDPRYWSDHIGFRCVFPLERIIQEKEK